MAININHMATCTTLLLLPLLGLLFQTSHGESPGIAVYWGQNGFEGTLTEACLSGYYSYIIIAFIYEYGSYQPPSVNLAGHCTPSINNCKFIGPEITRCQSLGIKVLISVGGANGGRQRLVDQGDAKYLADYIYNNFLGGSSSNRLFGDAVIDGVDFDMESPSPHLDDFARYLNQHSTPERKVYLSAAPQCPFPDANIGAALNTGLFDYVWIQFYNNPPCQYNGNSQNLVNSWNIWISSINARYFFLGFPANPQAAGSGFVNASTICNDILPKVKNAPKYGGVMIWSRFNDTISPHIINCVKGETPIDPISLTAY